MELRAKEKISYGIGAVGKDMVYMLSASYVLYYYQDILHINAIFMGVILMVARVFDAVNDPFMGVLVAKTKTKWGKFRPWLFSGTVLNAVILFALFATPQSVTGTGLKVYAAVIYILWGVTYTMMDIPYWSMIPAFAKKSKDRESLSTLARSCAGVGSAFITIITIWAVNQLGGGNERRGFMIFALLVAVFFVIAEAVTCINIKEKSTVDMPTTSVKDMFKALFQNDQAVTVVMTIVLLNCALYTTSNLIIYFFKYDIFAGAQWQNPYTLFNMFGGAIQILSMMILFPLVRKVLSTIHTLYLSIGMAVAGYAILLLMSCLGNNNIYMLFIPGFLIFAAFGMMTVLTTVFLANTVDYGELKNGTRDESVIFSMQTFVVKLASGVAVLIASISLSVFNISQDTSESVANALSAQSALGLRLTMSVLPIIGLIAAWILFRKRFLLTEEKVDEIAAELSRRHQEN